MEPAAALIDPHRLMQLLGALEPSAKLLDTESDDVIAVLAMASQDDPGQQILYLVPSRELASRGDAAREWLNGHEDLVRSVARGARASMCSVVFAGNLPKDPFRTQLRSRTGATRVRLVSAVHHIWVDRLRTLDDGGRFDDRQRERLMRRLSSRWSSEEERHYTDAALAEVSADDGHSEEARRLLLAAHPDLLPGVVTVLYGPGGIGKTFFLRRLTSRMTRAALADACCGIPVFAELPLLLHADTLETWLAHQGIRLPLDQIKALVSHGVIIPVLDALDELVRGQAREGSRDFLVQVGETVESGAKLLLSSRDYYLNIDRLVQESLADAASVELTIGYFNKQGRRRYVQARTGLDEGVAALWANQLEDQSQQALSDAAPGEVQTLIGHPLFLDAFCETILRIPEEERAVAGRDFRITSPDIFGEIVGRVLDREYAEKFQPAWERKFGEHLEGVWASPFTPEGQQSILRHLVLLAARDSGHGLHRRELSDPRYRELRHGVFTFTSGVPEIDDPTPRTVLREIVRSILGEPSVVTSVPADEREKIAVEALDEVTGALMQHTLANTSSDLVDDLVFATRSRAYFDYILADCLLARLREALADGTPEAGEFFVDWCLAHHIFERAEGSSTEPPFASVLDFVLWHRQSLREALKLFDQVFSAEGAVDETLASYLLSLALAILLRTGTKDGYRTVEGRNFLAGGDVPLEVLDTIVPVVRRLRLRNCTFPELALENVRLVETIVQDCDFGGLRISGASLIDVELVV